MDLMGLKPWVYMAQVDLNIMSDFVCQSISICFVFVFRGWGRGCLGTTQKKYPASTSQRQQMKQQHQQGHLLIQVSTRCCTELLLSRDWRAPHRSTLKWRPPDLAFIGASEYILYIFQKK